MGNSALVATPGAEAVASAADGFALKERPYFDSQNLATDAEPVHFEIYDAADSTWLCAADAAAGGLDCHQREHGTVGLTVKNFNSQSLAVSHGLAKELAGQRKSYSHGLADEDFGAQDAAAQILSPIEHGSLGTEPHTYDETSIFNTSQTDPLQCGLLPSSESPCIQCEPLPPDASPELFDAKSFLGDFNSHSLANDSPSYTQCEPLPSHASP